jgi:hypothetical protein
MYKMGRQEKTKPGGRCGKTLCKGEKMRVVDKITIALAFILVWIGTSFALSDTDTVRTFVRVSSIATFSNPTVASRVYAVVDSAVYFSGNSGISWISCTGTCPPSMTDASQDRLFPGNGYVFAIAGNEIYRSGIGTNTWQLLFSDKAFGSGKFDQRSMAATGSSVFLFETDTVSNSILIMKSTSPDGNSFGDFLNGWNGSYGSRITATYSDSSDVVVNTDAGYTLAAIDGGASWTLKYSPATFERDSAFSFSVLIRMGAVFVGAHHDGVRRSVAASGTNESGWSAFRKVADSAIVLALTGSDGRLFAGTTRGLYVSSDTGATWTLMGGTALAGLAVSSVGICQNALLCGTEKFGLYRSADQGVTFAADTNGIPCYTEKYTVTNYLQAIPKAGDRRRYIHHYSSEIHMVVTQRTSLDIISVDSVVQKNGDTILVSITVIDSLLDTLKGWIFNKSETKTITIAGIANFIYCEFPLGVFGRYSDSSAPMFKVVHTSFETKEAYLFSYTGGSQSSTRLFVDSIGLVQYTDSFYPGIGSSGTEKYALVPDDSIISSVIPASRLKPISPGNTTLKYRCRIGSGPRTDAFLLNGRRGTWKTGAMAVTIKMERGGQNGTIRLAR